MLLISILDWLYIYFNFKALSLPLWFTRTLPLFLFSLQALLSLCRRIGNILFFLFFLPSGWLPCRRGRYSLQAPHLPQVKLHLFFVILDQGQIGCGSLPSFRCLLIRMNRSREEYLNTDVFTDMAWFLISKYIALIVIWWKLLIFHPDSGLAG